MFKYIPLGLRPLIFLIGALGFLFPNTSETTFLFCLKPSVEPLVISRSSSDQVLTDNNELNEFFVSNGIVNIEEWIPNATEQDRDGDIYLNRIYRAYISNDSRLSVDYLISNLNNFSFIKYAENEFIRKPKYMPNDPMSNTQCSLNSVKATSAWDFWDIPNGLIPDGSEVLLASVDTGVDYTHPDIQGNSWINQAEIPEWMSETGLDSNGDGIVGASEVVEWMVNNNTGDLNGDGVVNLRDAVSDGSPFEDFEDNDGNGYTDDLLGWDCSGYYGTDDNDPFPKEGVADNSTWAHGTHVAGILAATTDNGQGMASTSYNGKFISVKGSRENQSGEPGINDGYAGITYAAKAGYYSGTFTIINNSWGGGGYSASENSVINNAFNTYGAIIVCAAGNGDDNTGGQEYGSHYPSSYENSTSVCAMGCSYAWGNWATYHYTVDLAAPGENIHSAIIGTGYEAWDGSSMASPNAASCMGLLKSYYPNWTNQQILDRIYSSADRKVYDVNPEYETCNGNSGEDCFGHGMVDVYKAIGMDFSPNVYIDSSYVDVVSDDDGVLNPGETANFVVSLYNEQGWVDANAVIASLSTDNEFVTIINSISTYGSLSSGGVSYPTGDLFQIQLADDIALGDIDFNIDIVAVGSGGYQYTNTLEVTLNVSLFQSGYPFDTNSEIKSSPLVLDLDNDGMKEIVFADYNGDVRIIKDGVEINNGIFPYETGNQVWGAISSADMDLDGIVDFVVTSKSKYIYIFDINGLKSSYNANRYLIGTPVIGNLDSDPELEVVVGGYSGSTSSNPLFVINADGSDVDGFPYIVGEKVKAGVAVFDMDDNGIDDIVFGTDSDNIYVLLDDGTIAYNFPIDLGDKIQSEPAIYDTGSEKIILTGCKNNNFYAINYNDGSLRFTIPTGDDIFTSPSFNDNNIYFGSDDGNVYAVDINGNLLDGYPLSVSSAIVGSIVFYDITNDGFFDMVFGTSSGEVFAYDSNLSLLNHFPINYQFPLSSSTQIVDIDSDDDMEIIAGTSGDLIVIDYKNVISDEDEPAWSLFKGDWKRSGYYLSEGSSFGDCGSPQLGDTNCDQIINVIDVISIMNMILGDSSQYSEYELWSADLNGDGIVDIFDIITIVSIILDN
tara:strand:- start:4242 stop:7601 length:3360 start_codon:yes stop_codon:yes gene_type:complete